MPKIPSGRLRSRFIVSLIQKSLKATQGTVVDYDGIPVGLVGMVLTAVRRQQSLGPVTAHHSILYLQLERAANVVQPNVEADETNQPFSSDGYGNKFARYMQSLDAISAEKWAELMHLYIVRPQTPPPKANTALLDLNRGSLFSFESPAKGT